MPDLDTIILLTGYAEQPALTAALLGQNPLLAILPAIALGDLAAIGTDVLSHARLVAFATSVIVPREILGRLGYGAYNFHPGSRCFPGWAPAHFALYRGAAEFGATVHVMTEKVDTGPIVAMETFPVPAGISVPGLEGLAYAHLAKLFWRHAGALTRSKPLPLTALGWSGERTTRRLFASMREIPPDASPEEIERRQRVFGVLTPV